MTIIDRMCNIAEKMHKEEGLRGGMSFDLMENAMEDINALGELLGLTPIQVVFLTALVRKNGTSSVSGQALSSSLNLNYLKFLSLNKELEGIRQKGYVRIDKDRDMIIPRHVLTSLLENKPVEPEPDTGLSSYQLLVRIKRALKLLDDEQCILKEMVNEVLSLLSLNPTTSISKGILRISKKLTYEEDTLLFALIYLYHFEDDDMVGWHNVDDYFTDDQLAKLRSDYKREHLHLQIDGVMVYAGLNSVMEKDYFKLSDEVKEELFADTGGIKKKDKKISASKKWKPLQLPPRCFSITRRRRSK